MNIDDCQATPCNNNGTCIDQVNSFLCLCSSGYTDLRCQTRLSQCTDQTCLHGGTCRDASANGNFDEFICLCPPMFTGRQCERPLNPCTSYPCAHGSCIPTFPTYQCQCDHGYTGTQCETMIDLCQSGPCGYNATCTNLATRYSCCCPPGYTGSNCAQLIDICTTNPCAIEGTERCASIGVNMFLCSCKPGYSGQFCEINTNECLSTPVTKNMFQSVILYLLNYSFSVWTVESVLIFWIAINAFVHWHTQELIVNSYKWIALEFNVLTMDIVIIMALLLPVFVLKDFMAIIVNLLLITVNQNR